MQESFSPRRAVEALIFISQRLTKPTIHEVLKIQYFADKLHFSEHGFMASGDSYVAMKFGPVASNTYDLLKAAKGERGRWIHPTFVSLVEGSLTVLGGHTVKALRAPDLEELSRAQIACLEEAIEEWGNMPFAERTELSHDSAWTKAWGEASNDNLRAGEMQTMDILRTLPNAGEVLEHLQS
ncbi:Panacea domain-containing protein [Pseudomonas helleri]|uniref:Panacea domain-containing protein n=1 Tax=Pseudomonas helleri TaxID=1608996 RepID=UPI00069CF165|nr:Panacea domain-containing protein [Pseudomonas helleri]